MINLAKIILGRWFKGRAFVIVAMVAMAAAAMGLLWACGRGAEHQYEVLARASVDQMRRQGVALLEKGFPDSALTCFTVAANKYREEMPDSVKNLCASAANNAGYVFLFYLHDYPSAYSWFLKAVEIARQTPNSPTPAYAYLNIGNIYLIYNDMEGAARYHKMAFENAVSTRNWPIAVTVLSNLVAMQWQLPQGQKPDISRELAAFDSLKIGEAPLLAYTRSVSRAVKLMEEGNTQEALQEAIRSRELVGDELTADRYRWGSEALQAEILSRAGQKKQAIELLQKIATKAAELGELDNQADAYRSQAAIYDALSQPTEALECMKMAQKLTDSLFRTQHYGALRDMGNAFALRELNNKVAKVETKQRRTATALWWSLVALMVVVGLGMVFYRQNRKLRFSNRQLFEHNQQMIALSEEAERTRNARRRRTGSPRYETEAANGGGDGDATEPLVDPLFDKINAVMDDVDTISSTDFSLTQLAKLVGSNYNYVSQAINDNYHKNFSTLLAERRVRQACIRLCDAKNYGNLTVEAIANGLGFKSRSNFAQIFKKVTGLTPTEYRKLGKGAA